MNVYLCDTVEEIDIEVSDYELPNGAVVGVYESHRIKRYVTADTRGKARGIFIDYLLWECGNECEWTTLLSIKLIAKDVAHTIAHVVIFDPNTHEIITPGTPEEDEWWERQVEKLEAGYRAAVSL